MSNSLDNFIKNISNFINLSPSDMIPYFVYYLCDESQQPVTPKMVYNCYENLSLIPYSNVSAYLSRNSSGKSAIFIKGKSGYLLTRQKKEAIANAIRDDIPNAPSNDLIDLSIVEGAPFYIKKMTEQMCCCYDTKLYDACLVMMRKLFETLIIECFERHSSANEIKDMNGNFYYLSDLIPIFISCNHWSVSRNLEKHIKLVKKYGDLSAHNRRFFAKKKEIDGFRFEMRQSLQEIILIIDYENWDRSNPTSQQ